MTKEQKKDMARAEVLMTDLFNVRENERALKNKIANELKAYQENGKSLEEELIEIANRNPNAFDMDGNLKLTDGYIHQATKTKVAGGKKFSLSDFLKARPLLIEWSFKVAAIKKLWLDKTAQKELKQLGVEVDTCTELQVIPNKAT